MLPEPVLDDEQFGDIMDEARNMIVSLYPEWTDFNYHDPGITLIELFAWMKENQQYHLDQISGMSRERYLKLLGERRLKKAPSRAIVDAEPDEDVCMLAGTKLFAGQVCFMTRELKMLVKNDARCWFFGRGQIEQIARREAGGRRAPAVAMFGQEPREGDCFYICFDSPLPAQQAMSIYIELAWAHKTARCPIGGSMYSPLARIGMEYFSGGEWKAVSGLRDQTHGAVQSGLIHFCLDSEPQQTEVMGQTGCFLRIVLLEQDYDLPPLIESAQINRFEACQRDEMIEQTDVRAQKAQSGKIAAFTHTLGALNGGSDVLVSSGGRLYQLSGYTKTPDFDTGVCRFEFETHIDFDDIDFVRVVSHRDGERGGMFLAEGTGFPFQQYDLADSDVECGSFELMVRSAENPAEFLPWTKVEDFSASGAEDRHYMLDSTAGTVSFGDCFHGMAPEGDIIITRYARTLGSAGDVAARRINRFEGLTPQDITVYNRRESAGGRDGESTEDSFRRVSAKLASPLVCVSDSDYERRVLQTPGLVIESCKVIDSGKIRKTGRSYTDEPAVNIVVKPAGGAKLSAAYRRNILAHLESCREAGRKINLLSPVRVVFEVFGNIIINPHYVQARDTVRAAVEQYFEGLGGIFGATVSYSDLYGTIERLPCVVQVGTLNMDARGAGFLSESDGSVTLPSNGLAVLGECRYLFSVG